MTPNKKKDSNENPVDQKIDQEVEDIESSYDNESTIKTDDETESENLDLQKKIHFLDEKVLRAQAEVDNVRKTSQKEILKAKIYSAESITKDLLSPIDNLQRSLEHSNDGIPQSLIELVLKEISQALTKNNIEEIYPLGEKFDPNFHEALSVKQDQQKDPEIVLEVIQKGYKIQDRVIRPALVIVNKI